ncbi:RNA-binding protein [Roseomonas sp. WA12]
MPSRPPRTARRTATPAPDPQAPLHVPGETEAGTPGLPDSPRETPGLPDPEEKGPLRRCVATRESLPKEAMIRFVLGPDRVLVPDLSGRMPGRGMWLSARGDVLERALTRGAFMKAARGPVHPIPELRETILDGLRRRIRDQVGLARRAGQAVVGFQQAREWLQNGRAALLVEASDGSAPERARLVGSHGVPIVSVLGAAELGAVFGRDHAVHVAVASGRLAQGILAEAGRLAGMLRTDPAASDAPGAGRRGRGQGRQGSGNRGPGTSGSASPHQADRVRPGTGGQAAAPRAGAEERAPRKGADGKAPHRGAGSKVPRQGADNEAPRRGAAPVQGADKEPPHRGDGPTSPRGGRQGTRPRRGGEPAVPVTQER